MTPQILIVGLSEYHRIDYAAALAQHGYSTTLARSIVEACRLLSAGLEPAAVIVNTQELGPDVVGFVQAVRGSMTLPVIVIGSSSAEKAVAQSAGADLFLFRPLPLEHLVNGVQMAVPA